VTDVVELRGQKALWQVEEPIPADLRQALDGESVMLSHLLFCRGYRTVEQIRAFFSGAAISHDPFLLGDMAAAVERIARAARDGERVAVYGDFDCDGITATAVLVTSLRALGLEPIVSIPTREDGHGLHPEALASLRDRDVSLVITADCGVSAIEEVRVARAMGMDVIVTDHHEPRADGSMPDCLVIAPTVAGCEYPCRFLCGVGLTYKLAQALAARLADALNPDELLDLVALGTIADIVPLLDENRTLVVRGLKRLQETRRPGLKALFQAAGVDPRKVDPTAVGYYLAPRINAANRMATPQLAYDLITATDDERAAELASVLSVHNQQRQLLVEEHMELIAAEIGPPIEIAEGVKRGTRPPVLVVIGSWPKGISGLLATKLVDVYGLPAFVGTDTGAETIAVSARGVPGVRVDQILERCEAALPGGIFLGFGGHAGAGGFSVERDRLTTALALLEEESAHHVVVDEVGAVLTIDAQVPLSAITLPAAQQIRSLAPFGVGFPEPLFLVRGAVVRALRTGNGKAPVRMRLAQDGAYRDAVWFKPPEEFLQLRTGAAVDLVFHVQIDDWQGLSRPELRIRDWRPAA
jgi:single-stranded-DNA-specific exonuclease